MKYILTSFLTLAFLMSFGTPVALAGDCFSDPVYDHDWSATVTTGARVRDVACMEGSVVLTTLSVGTQIAVTGETDGWYRVRTAAGVDGWVGTWLLAVSESPADLTDDSSDETEATTEEDGSLATSLAGRILLQVEQHGEAWYVHPDRAKRYYMKDGPTAYEMMRAFGLGISNADLARAQAGDASVLSHVRGRILLQVEAHGEAYYVHPVTGELHYMPDGDAAYSIMRELSLGITDSDLARVTAEEFEALGY